MSTLTLYLDVIENGRSMKKDGLVFSNVCVVRCWIDGMDLDDLEDFKDSLIYFNELEKSKNVSGNYLIFTCACGIAEDGGWEGVFVKHEENAIQWVIDIGRKIYRYTFDKNEYCDEIESLRNIINMTHLPLEPTQVIFPLNFSR